MKQKSVLYAIFIILGFLLALYGRELLGSFFKPERDSYELRVLYVYAWWVIPALFVTALIFGFRDVLKNLGLDKGFLVGILLAMVVVMPMFIGSLWHGEFVSDLNLSQLMAKTLAAGFMEELLFRGFLFGLLFLKLKWGFIPASLPGALIFGFMHIYQGSGVWDSFFIFLVTFMGALWFAWLYIEWNHNLWVPIWVHTLMNLSWALFYIDHTALGGLESNIFRILTIALSVFITVKFCLLRKSFNINKTNLLTQSK